MEGSEIAKRDHQRNKSEIVKLVKEMFNQEKWGDEEYKKKLQELVEKFNYLNPKLIEHPDYKDGNDFKDIVDKLVEKVGHVECILLKQKIFNQKGFFKTNQNYLDEDLVTRLVFHISKRKSSIQIRY